MNPSVVWTVGCTTLARALRIDPRNRVRDVVTLGNDLLFTAPTLEAAHHAMLRASDAVDQALSVLGAPSTWHPLVVCVELTATDDGRPDPRRVDVSWRHGVMQWQVRT